MAAASARRSRGVRPDGVAKSCAFALHHHVTTDQLVDALWPDVLPANPSAAVRVIITRLRASLGDHGDALVRTGSSYELHANYDIDRFSKGIEQGFAAYDRGDRAGAHQHLTVSYALWRGDPIPDLPVESPLTRTRLGLAEQRTTLVARLTRVQCALGDHERAVATISPLLSVVHENEILAVVAAEALAGAGRRGEALGVINRTRTRLRSQGIDPSPALIEIEQTVLTKPSDLRPAPILSADDSEVFVGRTAELAALSFSEACVSAVEGDAGLGKSVLLSRALESHRRRGVPVVRVQTSTSPQRPMDAVASLIERLAAVAPDGFARPELQSALRRLAPNIDLHEFGHVRALSRDSFLSDLAEVVRSASSRTHATIAIDDCQWLDRNSATVLTAALANPHNPVLLTTRPGAPEHVVEFLDAVSTGERFLLTGLDRSDIDEWLRTHYPRLHSSTRVNELYEASGGHPLALRLLIDQSADGALQRGQLPAAVLIAVQEGLSALSNEARDTVRLAAVAGIHFDLEPIVRARAGALRHLREAHHVGLITVDEHHGSFAHSLTVDAMLHLTPPGQLIELHDELAEVLQALAAPSTQLAHHALRAAALDPDRAIRAAQRAAEDQARVFDWDAVRSLTDQAIALMASSSHHNQRLHADVLLVNGTARRAMGDSECLAPLTLAIELAGQLGENELLARALTELCSHGPTTQVDGWTTQYAPRSTPRLRWTFRRPYAPRCWLPDRWRCQSTRAGARSLYLEALDLATGLEDPDIEADVLLRAQVGLSDPEDLDRRRYAAQRLGDIAGSDGDLGWEAAYLSFGVALIDGNRAEIDVQLELCGTSLRAGCADHAT